MIQEIKFFQEYLIKNRKDLKTVEAYCMDVDLILQFIKKPIYLIDEMDVEKYKSYLFDNSYRVSSINRKMVALNLFMKFHKHNIKINQEKVQMQNFLDNVIESDELSLIIKQAELKHDYRAKALLSSMYFTGMRISECLQLKITDIHKDTILIKGKGKKYRNVFVPQKLKLIWQEYILHRLDKGDMLFTGERGAITRKTSNEIFKKYAELAGVSKSKAHNHNLRHLYAKKLARNKISIEVIADLLGHSSLETSRVYLVFSHVSPFGSANIFILTNSGYLIYWNNGTALTGNKSDAGIGFEITYKAET